MQALLSEAPLGAEERRAMPSLSHWRQRLQGLRRMLPDAATADEAAKLNALFQMENLKSYGVVQESLARGSLRLHAWYYDIGRAELEQWDEVRERFVPLGDATTRAIASRLDSGSHFSLP